MTEVTAGALPNAGCGMSDSLQDPLHGIRVCDAAATRHAP
jgi:hypothetical protein